MADPARTAKTANKPNGDGATWMGIEPPWARAIGGALSRSVDDMLEASQAKDERRQNRDERRQFEPGRARN